MTAIFYITLMLLWAVLAACTLQLLETAAVHASETQLCQDVHQSVRKVIVLSMLTIGTLAQYGMSYVYALHLSTLSG